jgi:hypothetical protein
MTSITSDVTRRAVEDREGGTTRKHRRIIATLGPANQVTLREERTQNEFSIMLDELWNVLEYRSAAAAHPAMRRVRRGVL